MKKLERENMTKKIYDAVIEILKQGNYKVGDKIPTELALCEQLGVSRNSIREVSKALTLAVGTNTITVVATDGAGKTTTITRTVTLDKTAPVIKSVTLTPNPVDAGKTFIISVEVTD